jgi:isopenicillin-N N-acyltransferase-like protein
MVDDFKKAMERRQIELERVVVQSKKYLPYAIEFCPELVEEFRGYTDAAGADFDEMFAAYCYNSTDPPLDEYLQRCTDIVLTGEVTSDGSVYDIHNEDRLGGEMLCMVHAEPSGEPKYLMTTYGGLYPTTGVNSAGVSITGNLLFPNDNRVGVPKGFTVRKVLEAENIREAMHYALPERRASSYNQVLADKNGEIYCLEGSATDFEAIYGMDGYLVHTNCYLSDRMKKYEKDRNRIADSLVRYNRALRLVKKQAGRITVDYIKTIMSDHVGSPYSICRHKNPKDPAPEQITTLFSVIMNVTNQSILFCLGNPCSSEYVEYTLT